MDLYPYKFTPICLEKIWGGRNLERLFGRALPAGRNIGESWELADLLEDASKVADGPLAGTTLTELTGRLGRDLLGGAPPMPDGRFPLLLKLLDANDILSLQVHPDAKAAKAVGGVPKSECWYVLESRGGFIYKGCRPGVGPKEFRRALEANAAEQVVVRYDVAAGDFHYLPAGTVHALGAGVVVAEVQTPSDTTYRVSDWGRGREIHVEQSMRCIHFVPPDDRCPGAQGETLLATEFFAVARRRIVPDGRAALPAGRCCAIMMLAGSAEVIHSGPGGGGVASAVPAAAGDTVLVPAGLVRPVVRSSPGCAYLEITLPEAP